MSVAHVVERSGVSRRTFYEMFADREDCLLATFEQALAYASERVLPAYESGRGWREKIRAGLTALMSFLDEEPVIGRLLVAESFSGGPRTLARRAEVVAKLTSAIELGRVEANGSATIPPLTGESLVGGALRVIHSRLAEERDHAPLIELTNPLMSIIVLPYLGSAAARRELERPTPRPSGRPELVPLATDPFKGTGLRLTYRTVCVLLALAEHANGSNRVIGDTAGITDQGQISKLLTRLERIGLIANTGQGVGKGMPNAWSLTEKGRRVVSTITAHTEGHRAAESNAR